MMPTWNTRDRGPASSTVRATAGSSVTFHSASRPACCTAALLKCVSMATMMRRTRPDDTSASWFCGVGKCTASVVQYKMRVTGHPWCAAHSRAQRKLARVSDSGRGIWNRYVLQRTATRALQTTHSRALLESGRACSDQRIHMRCWSLGVRATTRQREPHPQAKHTHASRAHASSSYHVHPGHRSRMPGQ